MEAGCMSDGLLFDNKGLMVTLQDVIAEDASTHGSMFVPVILGSDKTTVSVATCQNEYYPLYISNGIVHNSVRRAHKNAVSLLVLQHGTDSYIMQT
jgi:hypothetical protein